MAALFGNKLVLPIGCSCITQFQLLNSTRLLPARPVSGFFDWAGSGADSTVEILNRRKPFIRSVDDLEVLHGRVRAKSLRVHFWHINQFFEIPMSQKIDSLLDYPEGTKKFVDHHRFLMGLFHQRVDELHCLWTNVQPNLRQSCDEVRVPWSDFRLTSARYAALKESCARLNARKISVWFICRRDHMDPELAAQRDVTVLDVVESQTDCRGETCLFDPVFEQMGICRPAKGPQAAVRPGVVAPAYRDGAA